MGAPKGKVDFHTIPYSCNFGIFFIYTSCRKEVFNCVILNGVYICFAKFNYKLVA